MPSAAPRNPDAPVRPGVLVLGGGSLVGRHLLCRLGPGRAVATTHRRPVEGGLVFDALTMSPDVLAAAAAGCSHAVILTANANPDDCARDPAAARRLNVEAILAIIERLDRWGVLPVFASTEAVFDGTRGEYGESDPVAPLMVYAAQKVEVERHLAARGGKHLIVRLSRVVGTRPGDGSLFAAWLDQIGRNEDIRAAGDHVFTPIHADDVAEAIVALIDGGHDGLFHLAGPDRLDRMSMLRRLLAHWRAAGRRYDGTVTACRMADFPTIEPRPRDISLRADKLIAATGVRPRGVDAICAELVAAVGEEGRA